MKLARVGDTASGTCDSHDHTLTVDGTITSSQNTTVFDKDNVPFALVGDIVTFSCTHTGIILDGTSIVTVKGIPVAVEGSNVGTGTGNIIAKITSGSESIQGE